MAEEQIRAIEDPGFEFETKTLGSIRCRPLDLEVLFRFTDLVKALPDTMRECVCSLLSAVGERRDASVPEDRGISREQARTLTDQELEQFAARFLEAANWIGPGGTAELTTDGVVECSHSERLNSALRTYEQHLAKSKPHPLPNLFSDVVPKQSQEESRSISDDYTEAERLVCWRSAQDALSGFRKGGFERRPRGFGLFASKLKGFLNGGKNWQERNSTPSQRITEAFGSLQPLKQNLLKVSIVSFRALQKIPRQAERAGVRVRALRLNLNPA